MRIPSNPFGQAVPRAAPQPGRAPLPAQFRSDAVERAVENLGQVGESIATAQMSDALRAKQEEERRQAAELEQMRRQQEAADKAQALSELGRAQDALADAHDEVAGGVQTGQVAKGEAETVYRERAAKIASERMSNVPEAFKSLVGRQIEARQETLGNGIRRAISRRDQQDTEAGLTSHLERMQREAMRDPAAIEAGIAAIDQLGPFTTLNPAQREKLKQAFKEGVALNRANALYSQASGSIAALTDVAKRIGSDEFADIDPGRTVALLDRIDTRKLHLQQQAEVAAQRAAREEERRLRVASTAADAFSKFLDSGAVPDEGYIARVQAETKGTPFAEAIPAMMKQAAAVGGFATQPVTVMDATITRMRNQAGSGTDPQRLAEIDRLERIRDATVRDYREDPLEAAHKRGVIRDLQPVDLTNLSGLPQQLATRREQAAIVSQVSGEPASPLTAAEAHRLGAHLATLPPEQKANWLATLGTVIGDRTQVIGLARQIDKQDPLLATAMMYADTKTTQGRAVSEIILRGQQAKKDGRVKIDQAKETGWRASIAAQIGDAYIDQELRGRMIEATLSIATGLAAEGSGPDLKRAVRLATGGIQVQADGSRIPIPYGWTEREFRDRLKSYPAERLPDEAIIGGVPVAREQLSRQLPDAVLTHAGQGKYVIRAGGGFVTDRGGRRVLLDFN